MVAQYDAIAQEYQRTRESPLRRHVEAYSFFRMLGDVSGLAVLDLACGEGFYSRLIRKAGAAAVTGVDVSAEMIALADSSERSEPLGINYICHDVASLAEVLPAAGCFDVVTAAYLLHYAPDKEQLQTMCRQIAAQLKPGGRLVCINENPDQPVAAYAGYTQYGFNKSLAAGADNKQPEEGTPISYAMVSGRQLIRFNAYYYRRATYEVALRAAGFSCIRWRGLELSPQGVAECGEDYWQEYLANPPVTGLECQL